MSGFAPYRKIRTAVCILAAVLLSASVAGAKDADVVRVGFFESPGMFEGASEGALKSGYCFDYIMQIATYTGWKYEFCYGTFAELYEKLKNGEIDILPYTNFNERRNREVLFSQNALAIEEYYLVAKKGYLRPGGLSSLNGAVISTMKDADFNSLLFSFIRENNLNVKVDYYGYVDEIWDALRGGSANLTIYTSNSYSRDNWDCICSFGKKPTYICVAKSRPDLLKQLDEAAELINTENPAFQEGLYAKYFSDNPWRKSLAAEEQEWLDAHPVIHIGGFSNDAPYVSSYNEDTHSATGLTADVISGIVDRLDLDVKTDFRCYDTLDELESALESGEIDIICPFYPNHNIALEHNLVISNTVRVSNMALVFKNGISYAQALEKVATPATRLGIYYVGDNYPDSEVVEAVSVRDAVEKVRRGEATGAIAQNVMLQNISKDYSQLNGIILPEGCGTCFAATPENYPLIRIINRGLIYFSSAEISALASTYSLESRVTLKAFLITHKYAALMLGIIVLSLIAMAVILIQVSRLKMKADAANRSKSTFLLNMSHDIRTPMNAIKGFAEMAKKNADDKEKVTGYLDKIDVAGKQLLMLINQVLEMSRIESGKLDFNESPVDIREKFESMVTVLTEQARDNGLDFQSSIDVEHSKVLADDTRMGQITLNLAGNSMKYTPKGGKIDFSLKEIQPRKSGYGTYVFTISDTGIGMSQEFQKHLFESFAREHNSTVSKIQGTGLGLSIVKNLVDMLGGKIDVQSEPGKGTRFDVTVDLRLDESSDGSLSSETVPHMDLKARLKGKRVLLVEDNEMNREIARFILEDQGMSVDEVEDGDIAVEKIRSLADAGLFDYYDFVLMDVQMPRMNGYEATRQIRSIPMPDGLHLPIIAMTANAFAEDRQLALEAGMDDHVAKPIDINHLLDTLEMFL